MNQSSRNYYLFNPYYPQVENYKIFKDYINDNIKTIKNGNTPKKKDDYIESLSIKKKYLNKSNKQELTQINNSNNKNLNKSNIQLRYKDEKGNNLIFTLNINSKQIKIIELKKFIISEYPMYFYGKTSNDLIFYFNNSKGFAIELNDDEIIKKFNLLIEIKLRDYYPNFANRFFNKNDYKNNIKSQFPIITKFHSLPSIEDLKLMPIEKLSKINHFTIWNNFGKIEFLNDLNITNINFDNDIILKQGTIEINDNSILHKAEAIISLYNIMPNGKNFENDIKKYIEDMNGKFLYYNNNTLIFKFN